MTKILAIDDNLDNLISLKAIIHDALPNSKVVTATNGLQGIELAIAEDPDVILLDIFMPEMDGFEVCGRLKQDARVCDIPVVFLTAQKGDKESRIKALELGAEAFLSKPIEVIELTAQIRAMLKIRTANKHKRDEKERLEALVYKRTSELERELEERKLAEQALKESEEKLRTIFENVQDIYYEASIDGTILEVSPSVEIVFKNQHTRHELIGTNIYELYADTNERKALIEFLKKNGRVTDYEISLKLKDGSVVPCSISSKLICDDDGRPEKIIGSLRDVTERKRMQEAIEKRIIALTSPLSSDKAVLFDELFNLADIQRIQDEFAAATGVASIITHPDGTPITKPSQFTRFCIDIVRKTEKGCANCYKSDAALGSPNAKGAIVRTCLSGGLWDAGASITVGGKHIANWLIGQVRDETQNEENIRNYAREIEVDENLLIEAFLEVPSMTHHRFEQIAKALFTLANQLSVSAYQNVQQARFISERNKAEEELRESNKLNNSLLQTIPFGMDIVDEHGNILFQSDFLHKLLGKDVKGEKCWNVYRDDHLKCPDCPLKEEIVVGKTTNCEVTSVFGDRTFQIIHTGMMFKGKKAILEIFQDITERKRAEELIKTLGKAIEQGPSSIVIANLKGDIEFVNNRFTEITQYTLEEVAGKKPRIFNPGHLNEKDTENLWTTLNEGKIWKGEVLNRRKDRTVFWEETTISTLIDAEGKISNFILIMDDITAKKQMVDELIDAKQKAEESDRLKSAFLANMSHEIRTPLNSILGFTELLSDPSIQNDEDQRMEYAQIINTSGANLLAIINDIIDISKIEAGQVQVNQSCFSAQELIRNVCKEYSLKAQKKGIELSFDQSLPENDVFIESDSAKIKQVLINFVGNALKFTEKGYIKLGLEVTNESARFYVKDTGIGIPKEFHSHVFERFRQIEGSATRKYGGNGLGLAISKSLIELLGGTIVMESEEGKGSTFLISIPFKNITITT